MKRATILFALALLLLAAWKFNLVEAFHHGRVVSEVSPLNDGYGDLALSIEKTGIWEFPRRLTPVVSLAFAGIYFLGGGFQWIPFIHGVFYLSAILILFLTLRFALGMFPAIAGAVAAVLTTRTEYLRVPMSEGLTFFFAVSAACCLVGNYRSASWKSLYGAVFFGMLTALSRPALQFFLPIVFGYVLWRLLRSQRTWFRVVHGLALFALLFGPVLGWMAYNHGRSGKLSSSHIASLSAACSFLPFFSGHILSGTDAETRQGLELVNQQLDGKLLSAPDEAAFQSWLQLDRFPEGCRSYRSVLGCKLGDRPWLAEYLRRGNMPFSMALVDAARVVNGETEPREGEHSLATLVLANRLSTVILEDVVRQRPDAILRVAGINLQSELLLGPPFHWADFMHYSAGLPLLVAIAALARFVFGLFRGRAPSLALFSLVLFTTLHLAHLLVCAIFGHVNPRYIFLLFPLYAACPAVVLGLLLQRFVQRGYLQVFRKAPIVGAA